MCLPAEGITGSGQGAHSPERLSLHQRISQPTMRVDFVSSRCTVCEVRLRLWLLSFEIAFSWCQMLKTQIEMQRKRRLPVTLTTMISSGKSIRHLNGLKEDGL